MAGNVIGHVLDVMGGPMVWGQADCCSAACSVFNALHGVDPMRGVRGSYSTAAEALSIIEPWGGLLHYAEHLASLSGLTEGRGAVGDIGISKQGHAIGLGGRCLLICVAPGVWAAKTRRGFSTLGKVEKSWRTP